MEMARRKHQEALLLEKAQTGHASPSLMENDVALFAAGPDACPGLPIPCYK